MVVSSIITKMLEKLYPRKNHRILMVSLESAGKTTILYALKLGECIQTIPTLGFNVETVEYKNTSYTMWDVGGCDKIRPLWRHYYQNTKAVIFVVDSNDRDRVDAASEELNRLLNEHEIRDAVLLVFANKQDLPNAMSAAEITDKLGLKSLRARPWHLQLCSATTVGGGDARLKADGLYEGLQWIHTQLEHLPVPPPTSSAPAGTSSPNAADSPSAPAPLPAAPPDPSALAPKPTETDEERLEATLLEWLAREDATDDAFLAAFADYSLDYWDHYTHLRIAWLLLKQHGRREGMRRIFEGIRAFIDNSPRTKRSRGTTFHETMTYFWTHMVHYAIEAMANPTVDFKTFLLLNPQLCNGGMFLHYYSKKLMLLDPSARTQVVLPDVRPLPSLLSSVHNKLASAAEDHVKPSAPLTDDEWLARWEARSLSSWGHEARLRLIWVRLSRLKRREALAAIFDELRAFEGEGHHVTRTYFWIGLVTAYAAKAPDAPTFADFYRRPTSAGLRNVDLIYKHYSQKLLDFDPTKAVSSTDPKIHVTPKDSFVPPDLKPLPSVV